MIGVILLAAMTTLNVYMIRFDMPKQMSWCEKQGTTEIRICAPQPMLDACKMTIKRQAEYPASTVAPPQYDLKCLQEKTKVTPLLTMAPLPSTPRGLGFVPK